MDRPPMETAVSTDVVVDIVLNHLKASDLLNCRQVSKCWNKAASSVLRRHWTMIKKISDENQLMELEECMEQSSDFPFAGLEFDQPWTLTTARAMKFFQEYGERFTRLCLALHWTMRLQDLAPFINHLPRLSILEQSRSSGRPPPPQLLDSAAGPDEGKILKLSSVRTIRILLHSPEVNEDVLREVLLAASSSDLRIECLNASYEILRILKNVGKLHALSMLNVFGEHEEGEDLAFDLVFDLVSTESPALTTLSFQDGGCISREGLMTLLISSQHTLKELHLEGLCPSELSSECPVLAKLTTLSLRIEESDKYIFQKRQGHKFPALKELTIDTDLFVPIPNISDGLFFAPSVTRIKLGDYVDKDGMEDLARSFPNVNEVRLNHRHYDFEKTFWQRDPTDIWNVGAFKLLEKLKIWDYSVRSPTEVFDKLKNWKARINWKKCKMMNMDSFLTGMSIGMCENLRKQPQQNLKDSPFNEILRDCPSLLQLKNLKELIVNVTLEEELEELPEEPPFISMVSVWYALEMMPNLEAKFVYEHNSPSWRREEERRVKGVKTLKAAFKHVKPYIELEAID